MGVITKLSLSKINELISDTNIEFIHLEETINGITDSTYIGTTRSMTKYICKIFEFSTLENIKNKLYILNSIKHLEVPKIISKNIILYNNKPIVLFSYINGNIPKKITLRHIEQVAFFLSKLHKIKDIKTNSQNIYTKNYFEKMLNKIDNKDLKDNFEKKYDLVKDINLDDNSLIHGDLFPDNAKFIDERLSGVYDFTQACFGNFYFDLAVFIVSWCFEKYTFNEIYFEKVLEVYSKNSGYDILKKDIVKYLLFACLYYSIQRITRKSKIKDYKEYQIKFDILEKKMIEGTNEKF